MRKMNLICCLIVVLLDIVVHGEVGILDGLSIEKYNKLDIDKKIFKPDLPVPYTPIEKPALQPVKTPIIPSNPVYYRLTLDGKAKYEDSYEKPAYSREIHKKISNGPSKSLSIESYHKISAEGLIPKFDIGDIISKKLDFKEDLLHKKEELINNIFKHSRERSGESYYKRSKYNEKPDYEIGDVIAKKEAFKEGLIDKISKHDNERSDNNYYQESNYDHRPKSSLDIGDVIDKKVAFKQGLIDKISHHGKDVGGIIAKKEDIKEDFINKISKHSIERSEESKYDNSGKHSLDFGDIIAKKEAFKEGIINKVSKNGFGKDISIEVSHKISTHNNENKYGKQSVVPKLY